MNIYIVLILLASQCQCQLYLNFPPHVLSYCTYRMNYTKAFGCNSNAGGSTGNVLFIRSFMQMQYEISQLQDDTVTFVIPAFIFADENLIRQILSASKYISGLVVIEPNYCTVADKMACPSPVPNLPSFSERSWCDEPMIRVFYTKYCDYTDMFGSINYMEIDWPFPLIFVYRKEDYIQNLIDCYENYNVVTRKGKICKLTIKSHTAQKRTSSVCIGEEHSSFHFEALEVDLCLELTGHNIYLTFNKVTYYKPRSIVLIITKMDSASLFDKAPAGTFEIYPSLSLLMYMAGLFSSSSTSIDKNSDILLGFLDNESLDELGSLRMIYDLKTKLVSNGVVNISDRNIKFIISLDDFSASSNKLFIFLNKCTNEHEDLCHSFINFMRKYHNSTFIFFYNMTRQNYTDKWIENLDVPKIIIRTSIQSGALYKHSFLDRMQYKSTMSLTPIGNILAKVVLQFVAKNNRSIKPDFDKFRPDVIAECFYKASCDSLKQLIGPRESEFYELNANPFISQNFVDGSVYLKQGEYKNRLSYFVLKLLVYYFHISFKNDSLCRDINYQFNFTITVKDIRVCYLTRIQAMRDFNPLRYAKGNLNFSHSFTNFPVWTRSNVLMKQSAKLFVSVHEDLQTTAMVYSTLISSLCFVGSIFLYRSINIIIPPEIF